MAETETSCVLEVTPFDQSQVIRNTEIFNLNYTNQDFFSLKSRLITFISERFGPDGTVIPNTFNDFVEGSVAIMLIENWAFIADMLSFKIDQIANEIFIDTVTELENAFRLAQLVGFEPTPPIAARAFMSGTLNAIVSSDVTVAAPFSIRIAAEDGQTLNFEIFPMDSNNEPIFNQDIVIPAGTLSNQSLIALEGRTVISRFQGTGEPNQIAVLSQTPVILDSIRVNVDGAEWEEVDFFTDSQPRREFRTEFDSDFAGFVIFGNNRAGLSPSRGSVIEITYRVGGGEEGNVISGFIVGQTQSLVPALQFPVPINFTNYTKGEFGYSGDTIEDIRRKLPVYIRTQDRAVTGEDYKVLADQFATPFFGQIGKSTAVLRNHGCAANIVDLYVLAQSENQGLQEANDQLKEALREYINDRKMLTDYLCIRDGIVVEVDVSIDAITDKFNRKFEQELRNRILTRINTFFLLERWDYGQTLRSIDVVKALSDITEIDTFEIEFTTNDPDNSGQIVTAEFNEIIRPINIDTTFLFN